MTAQNILLAKQPIYRADRSLYGHELLFRNPFGETAMEVGEELATTEVLVNYCSSISDQDGLPNHPVFLNVSERFLMSDAFLPVNVNRVVIELVERIDVTPEFVSAINKWKQCGFKFALDDFDFSPTWQELIPLADFIKVEISEDNLAEVAERLGSHQHLNCQWVAEKVETEDMFNQCVDMGFDLYQGYFLARPKEIVGSTIRASAAMTAQIIRETSKPDTTMAEIAELVSHDPKLSVQMLKIINSSLFTLPRAIDDLKEAIVYLGIESLRQWAILLAFLSNEDAPLEAARIVLIRAKACEIHYQKVKLEEENASSAFLTGLLSGIDLLLDIKPAAFIEQLKLAESISYAVLKFGGPMGSVLMDIIGIEFDMNQQPKNLVNREAELLQSYMDASRWADKVIDALES